MSAPIGAAIATVARTASSQYLRRRGPEVTNRLAFTGDSESHAPLERGFNGIETRQTEAGGAAQKGLWGVASASNAPPRGAPGSVAVTFVVAVALRYKRYQLVNQLASLIEDVRP